MIKSIAIDQPNVVVEDADGTILTKVTVTVDLSDILDLSSVSAAIYYDEDENPVNITEDNIKNIPIIRYLSIAEFTGNA